MELLVYEGAGWPTHAVTADWAEAWVIDYGTGRIETDRKGNYIRAGLGDRVDTDILAHDAVVHWLMKEGD